MRTEFIDPRLLKPNPFNPNRVSPENMAKLKKSIEDLGFASSVVCRELPDGSLEILGGYHRTEAAIELGLSQIPVLNLGPVSDDKAKKIGLVDNSRYGVDDTISLANLIEELGVTSEELASFMPFTETDFDTIRRTVDIDLDDLDFHVDDDEDEEEPEKIDRPAKALKTHEVMRFRVSLANAERIRQLIEKTIRKNGLDADTDELTAAGDALALLLLSE